MGFQNKFGHREKIIFGALRTGQAEYMNSVIAFGNISTNTTLPTDTTGATLIVLAVTSYTLGTTPMVSDTMGNIYTALPLYQGINGARVSMYYCINPITSPVSSFKVLSGSGYPSIMASFYKGGIFSYQSQNGNVGGNLTSLSTNAVPVISANNLTVSTVNYWIGNAPNFITSGFNIVQTVPSNPFTLQGAFAYKLNSVLASENPTWSWTTPSFECSAIIANFNYI